MIIETLRFRGQVPLQFSLIFLLLLVIEIDDIALLVAVETGWAPSPSSYLRTTIDMGIHSHMMHRPPPSDA